MVPRSGSRGAGISRRWAAPALIAAVLVGASLVPAGGGSPAVLAAPGLDLLLHVFGYAALAWSVAWARLGTRGDGVAGRNGVTGGSGVVAGVVVAVLLGAAVELLQGPLPTRHASVLDAVANLAGALLGAAAWRVRAR